jgi:hypothetical protein
VAEHCARRPARSPTPSHPSSPHTHPKTERRRAREAVAAAAAGAPDHNDDEDDDAPAASPLDAALDALTARQAAARTRGLAALHALLRGSFRPDAADRPVSIIAALKAVLGKRGGSGADNATAASCAALAFLLAGPSADSASAFEGIAPALATMAASVKGGPPSARAAACTALAVGAFVVGDAGGPEVVEAVDVLATAAASRVIVGDGGGSAAADAPTAVAAAALRGLALLATVSWPSQAAALAEDGRVLRALSGALSASDVDVRHAAGLAAVALRLASGTTTSLDEDDEGGGDGGSSSSDDEHVVTANAALTPALARVRGLASSSYAAGLDRLAGGGGGGGGDSGTATPTGFRCANGLRLSRAARTEQRRLFRGLEVLGGGGPRSALEVRAAVLRRVGGPVLGDVPWLADVFGGGGGGARRWADGGGGGGRAGKGAKEKGRASAACEAVRLLAGDGEEEGSGLW